MKKKKAILIYPKYSSFVEEDEKILSDNFKVCKFHHELHKSPGKFFSTLVKSLGFLIRHSRKSVLIFVWFADYHSFFPVLFGKLLRKNVFLALGGYDVTCIKEINYGVFCKSLRKRLAGFSIRHATINLPVAMALKDEALSRVPKAKMSILPTGYDPAGFDFEEHQKRDIILTVGFIDSHQRVKIKGIDRFFEVADLMPDKEFIIIGVEEKLVSFGFIPKNIKVVPPLPRKEIINYYQQSKVYVQFSIREGLPNSVLEAMLCGNIPVGTRVGGIPEAISEYGYMLEKWNPEIAKQLILNALSKDSVARKMAREHAIENFTLSKRKESLMSMFQQYNIL